MLTEFAKNQNVANNCVRTDGCQLDKKIDDVTKGLNKEWSKNLLEGLSPNNAEVICNYIISMRTEINPADNNRRDSIK